MKKFKNGSFSVAVDLEVGREYQFRYLVDGSTWKNDPEADRQTQTPFGDSENSVIAV